MSLYVWEELDLYGADSKRVRGDDDDDWLNWDSGYSDIIMRDKFLTWYHSFQGFFFIAISLGLRFVWEGTSQGEENKSILALLLKLT